jgi:hypothetical protein
VGTLFTDFMLVKAGALHRASGGFLVIEALEPEPIPFDVKVVLLGSPWLYTGVPAGERGADGAYPEGTANFLVQTRLREMAEQARAFHGNGESPPVRSENGT